MKKLRILFIIFGCILFYTIGLSGFVRNIYFSNDKGAKWGIIAESVKVLAELPSSIKKIFDTPGFYVKNNHQQDGVTKYVESNKLSNYPKLLTTYKTARFDQKFELLDLKTGKSIRTWSPDNKFLFQEGYQQENPRKPPRGSDLYFMHPLMLSDSSLVTAAQLSSLLVRIKPDNSVAWMNTDTRFHHSLEMSSDGNIWVCTDPFEAKEYDIFPDSHALYKNTLLDDEITKVNANTGEILFQKKMIELLIENGFEELILYKGQVISDPIHLNDIEEAEYTTEFWEKGDLLLSCRNLSVVILYRPSTNKIIWLKHGPWLNQHDADFLGNSKIVVFGNDIIREESRIDPKLTPSNLVFTKSRPHNEVYVYDFAQDTVITPYSPLLKEEKVMTITSGRCDILENGDLFIEDTNNGRIIIGDSVQKKLEYVKRIDDAHISSMFWSRIIN